MNCLRFQPMSLVLTTHIIILLLLCDVWAIALIPSRQCSSYFDGNTTTATCDDIPNYICTRGCYGPFVTSQGCQSNTGRLPLTSPLTTQVCNLGFSPHDLEGAPNACLTSNAAYLCRGAYSGTATCYNCRDTENLYSKGRSPPYWSSPTEKERIRSTFEVIYSVSLSRSFFFFFFLLLLINNGSKNHEMSLGGICWNSHWGTTTETTVPQPEKTRSSTHGTKGHLSPTDREIKPHAFHSARAKWVP